MSFYDYLSAKAVSLCAAGIGAAYLILVSFMCGISKRLIIMLLVCAGVGAAVWLLVGWRLTDRRLRTLKRRIDGLPEKYLIGETLDCPKNPIELEYYLLMKEISRSAIGAVEQARADKQDYCDYVESWVHEIKTPLTACSLILSNSSDPAKLRGDTRRELRREQNEGISIRKMQMDGIIMVFPLQSPKLRQVPVPRSYRTRPCCSGRNTSAASLLLCCRNSSPRRFPTDCHCCSFPYSDSDMTRHYSLCLYSEQT